MREFEKIEWGKYNKPPYYQQWLCKDDTLKLATFGDKGLAELDCQILKLIDQWDLDNVKGYFLDRIGKLLDEKRNGSTDKHYRIMLNLRRLLNTNNGSIPSIIQAIKYFYSSEVVHIVPDYPAGLIIEHDGEGTPGLNFNKLLTEVIPAGVSFSTKELFFFTDEFDITDALIITAQRKTADNFSNGLKYNGRGKYDGHTLNPIEIATTKYDSEFNYNAVISYSGKRVIDADSFVSIPFKYSSGIKDILLTNTPLNYDDNARSQLKYNGTAKYNGVNKYMGFAENSILDALRDTVDTVLSDNEVTAENIAVQIDKPLDEHFSTRNLYDGYFDHSGEAKYKAAKERFLVDAGEAATASETVVLEDGFSVCMRFLRRFNGEYSYDGEILYNGNVPIPM